MTIWRRRMAWTALGLYLVALGFLGGIAVERIRFTTARGEILRRFEDANRAVRAWLMALEHRTAAGEHPSAGE